MKLALSSAVAPEATLEELLTAAARRGLGAVELEAGHGHGVDRRADRGELAVHRAAMDRAGCALAAFRLTDPRAALDERTVRFAACVGAPVVAPVRDPAEGTMLIDRAGPPYAEAGALLLVACAGGPASMAVLRRAADAAPEGAVGLAWDIVPRRGGDVVATLDAAGERLRHVRLHGGGPEAAGQEGFGIGDLMGALALSGYAGSIAIAPSTRRYRVAWAAWLGRRGGWGCGGRAGESVLLDMTRASGC